MSRPPDIRVLIVDDQAVYRTALCGLLEAVGGYVVVGVAASGEEAVVLAGATAPDVVFMDLRLTGIDGVAAARFLRTTRSAPEVVMISTDTEALRADRVREAGVLLALGKSELSPERLEALHRQLTTRWDQAPHRPGAAGTR